MSDIPDYDKGYSQALVDVKNIIEKIMSKQFHVQRNNRKRFFIGHEIVRVFAMKIYDSIDEKLFTWSCGDE